MELFAFRVVAVDLAVGLLDAAKYTIVSFQLLNSTLFNSLFLLNKLIQILLISVHLHHQAFNDFCLASRLTRVCILEGCRWFLVVLRFNGW